VLRGVSLEHLWMFAASKTPVISIERVPGLPIDYVDFNNERAAHLATEHLIRAGHRRICYLAGPETSQSSAERARGFQLAHLRLGVPYDDARIIACGSSSADGYAAALQIYKEKSAARRPTALFCFSDLVALGVYQAAHKLGLRIPDDLSVVGCDDIDMSSILGPALTTVSFSVREVGRFVAQRMIEAVRNGRPAGGLAEVFHPRLIERDSVRIVEPAA
jgi:DNA-binding LacI/PurR family transcriptional regulator